MEAIPPWNLYVKGTCPTQEVRKDPIVGRLYIRNLPLYADSSEISSSLAPPLIAFSD
jgi:hypothetical protein